MESNPSASAPSLASSGETRQLTQGAMVQSMVTSIVQPTFNEHGRNSFQVAEAFENIVDRTELLEEHSTVAVMNAICTQYDVKNDDGETGSLLASLLMSTLEDE